MYRRSWISLMVCAACMGDATNDESASTTADASTSSGSSEGSSETDSEVGTDTDTDTGSDTDEGDLTCPLGEQAGVATLVLAPELFSDGADPSASPACAFINPERGFHEFVDLRALE